MSAFCPVVPSETEPTAYILYTKGDVMERFLRRRQLWKLRTRTVGVFFSYGGCFWLTRRGDNEDYHVHEGDSLMLPAGEWLIEALADGHGEWTTAVSVPVRLTHETDRLSPVSGL